MFHLAASGVRGAERTWAMEPVSAQLPPDLAEKWPYLKGCAALRIPADALKEVTARARVCACVRALHVIVRGKAL